MILSNQSDKESHHFRIRSLLRNITSAVHVKYREDFAFLSIKYDRPTQRKNEKNTIYCSSILPR